MQLAISQMKKKITYILAATVLPLPGRLTN